MNNELAVVAEFLYQNNGINTNVYDEVFFKNCIQNRMSKTSLHDIKGYCNYLKSSNEESALLVASLNNTFSEFFRNTLTFAYLEQIVLPVLIERKKKEKHKEIRIWSAACASGQEPYSIAILIDELIRVQKANLSCHIFATDINPSELTIAKNGNYPVTSLGKVSTNRLNNYFKRVDHAANQYQAENYVIVPDLGQYLDFSVFDLTSEEVSCPESSIYGNFDLVFCCNVLFYYKPDIRKHILSKIGNCLNSNALLITGEAEREIVKENNYREEYFSSGIFRKIQPNEIKSH
jgi:chemotaxis protein methyltransferase CheR